MVLARWQATVQDNEGNVMPGASVEVRREVTGAPLATIYSDRAGATPIGNPFTADGEGFAAFHVAGGAYRITVTSGSLTRTYRYVAIGLGAERDTIDPGLPWIFDSGVNDADPGLGALRFNNSTPGLATKLFINEQDADGAGVADWLRTWDDAGSVSNRGTVVISAGGGGAKIIARVTGSLTDDGTYQDVAITVISSFGSFVAGERVGVQFFANGTDGTGNVNGPGNSSPGIALGEISVFSATDGRTIDGSGKTIQTVGAGKTTVWVPAAAMMQRSGLSVPSFNRINMPSSNLPVQVQSYDFDPSSEEVTYFWLAMPKSWDEANVSFKVVWSHPSTTTNFGTTWQLYMSAFGNDDSMDVNAISSSSITDTGGTTNDIYVTDESPTTTISGAAEQDLIHFRLTRVVANGGDTLAVDARVQGVIIYFNENVNTDD